MQNNIVSNVVDTQEVGCGDAFITHLIETFENTQQAHLKKCFKYARWS